MVIALFHCGKGQMRKKAGSIGTLIIIIIIAGLLLMKKDHTNSETQMSQQNLNETGIHYVDGSWRYMEDGVWKSDVTGLVDCDGIWYYVENGIENWMTSLMYINDTWYYIHNGQVDTEDGGLVYYQSSWW